MNVDSKDSKLKVALYPSNRSDLCVGRAAGTTAYKAARTTVLRSGEHHKYRINEKKCSKDLLTSSTEDDAHEHSKSCSIIRHSDLGLFGDFHFHNLPWNPATFFGNHQHGQAVTNSLIGPQATNINANADNCMYSDQYKITRQLNYFKKALKCALAFNQNDGAPYNTDAIQLPLNMTFIKTSWISPIGVIPRRVPHGCMDSFILIKPQFHMLREAVYGQNSYCTVDDLYNCVTIMTEFPV